MIKNLRGCINQGLFINRKLYANILTFAWQVKISLIAFFYLGWSNAVAIKNISVAGKEDLT